MRVGEDLPVTVATAAPERSPAVFRFERRAMGSPLRLTVVDAASGGRPPDERLAERAWRLVSDEFEAAEQAMSRFRDSSDATAVNRAAGTGRAIRADQRLVRALVASDRAGRVTGGLFDARVLADLERLGYHGTDLGLSAGRSTDGRPVRWLRTDPRASLVALDAPVDLGGIGKGLALRWAWAALRRGGVLGDEDSGAVPSLRGALLEAGGDIVAAGPSPDPGPWLVAIDDPAGGGEPMAIVAVERGAVTTSSVQVHHWSTADGRPVHHLVDPRTGEPGGAGLLAVTVAGVDPAWSEVWSKTLFLHGAARIAGEARRRGLAAWWVRDDGRLEMTAAARARTVWVAAEA